MFEAAFQVFGCGSSGVGGFLHLLFVLPARIGSNGDFGSIFNLLSAAEHNTAHLIGIKSGAPILRLEGARLSFCGCWIFIHCRLKLALVLDLAKFGIDVLQEEILGVLFEAFFSFDSV